MTAPRFMDWGVYPSGVIEADVNHLYNGPRPLIQPTADDRILRCTWYWAPMCHEGNDFPDGWTTEVPVWCLNQSSDERSPYMCVKCMDYLKPN